MSLGAIVRQKRFWVIAAGVIVIGIILLAVQAVQNATFSESVFTTIDNFMTAVQQKHPDDAYKMLEPPPGAMSEKDFAGSPLVSDQIVGWTRIIYGTADGQTSACGNIQTPDAWIPFRMTLERKDSSWMIADFRYGENVGSESSNQDNICDFSGQVDGSFFRPIFATLARIA